MDTSNNIPNKEPSDLNFLELFITTIDEYKNLTNPLSIDWSTEMHEKTYSDEYSAIYVRSILIRKYITRDDNVHITKIINKAKSLLPKEYIELDNIYKEYVENYNAPYLQILKDGTELDMRKTFDDIIYGVFLHADFEKVLRLAKSEEFFRMYCLRKFVHSMEITIMKLYNILKTNNIYSLMNIINIDKAPTVTIFNDNRSKEKNISGYWSNLYGEDITVTETISSFLVGKKEEELKIFKCVQDFIINLQNEKINIESMKDFIHPESMAGWGDFLEAKKYFDSIPNPGMSSNIQYNTRKDVAYVKILDNVKNAFSVDQEHIITANVFTLIKDKSNMKWLIFNFGGRADPYDASSNKT